jgi:hypothetical protein
LLRFIASDLTGYERCDALGSESSLAIEAIGKLDFSSQFSLLEFGRSGAADLVRFVELDPGEEDDGSAVTLIRQGPISCQSIGSVAEILPPAASAAADLLRRVRTHV